MKNETTNNLDSQRSTTRARLEGNKVTGRLIELNDEVFIPNSDAAKLNKPFVSPYKVIEILPHNNLLLDNCFRLHMNQVRVRRANASLWGSVENPAGLNRISADLVIIGDGTMATDASVAQQSTKTANRKEGRRPGKN